MIKFDVWSRRASLALIGIALTATLASCGGGGGDAGGSVFDPGTGGASSPSSAASGAGVAADLVVLLSKTSLSNTGSDSLTVTATAIDSSNATVADVPVSFSVDGHATITKNGTVTATNGQLTATVNEGSDTTVRVVNVTVTSRSVSRTVAFNVVQSVATSTPQAADLSLTLDASSINNSGSSTITATATAVDANRNALVGIPIQLAVNSGAILVASGSQTDANGQVKGAITIGSDHSNRTVAVTATSGTLVKASAFLVTGAALQGTAVPSVLTAGASGNQVNFALTDVNKNPMAGLPITVTASGGLPSATSTTDSNGLYTYTYTAPATAGALTISATAGGASTAVGVSVPAGTSTVPTVSAVVSASPFSASPTVLAPNNSAGVNNIAAVNVQFFDTSNAPIKNMRVRFDLNGDPNSVGGIIGSGTNLIYSDATGTANSTYTPGAIGSPTNGVQIRACWDYSDFAQGACPHQLIATLTVAATPVSVTIGDGGTISTDSTGLQYVKPFIVRVVDQAGHPVPDVQITSTLTLTAYFKGFWEWNGITYIQYYYIDSALNKTIFDEVGAKCLSEDVNRNGKLDTGEDKNGSLDLDPRPSIASITSVGSTKTDSSGTVVVQITYPKNYGSWVAFHASVSAAGVLSPPDNGVGILPVAAADLATLNPPPAFVISPFGKIRLSTDVNGFCTN